MKTIKRLVTTALFASLLATAAHAGVPGTLNYQAFLTDASGAIDQTVSVVFALYASETGGTAK